MNGCDAVQLIFCPDRNATRTIALGRLLNVRTTVRWRSARANWSQQSTTFPARIFSIGVLPIIVPAGKHSSTITMSASGSEIALERIARAWSVCTLATCTGSSRRIGNPA